MRCCFQPRKNRNFSLCIPSEPHTLPICEGFAVFRAGILAASPALPQTAPFPAVYAAWLAQIPKQGEGLAQFSDPDGQSFCPKAPVPPKSPLVLEKFDIWQKIQKKVRTCCEQR